jgi:hypothetical protein
MISVGFTGLVVIAAVPSGMRILYLVWEAR